ncbi:unnamed protein product [Cylicocyclus nassatus]|uniref:Uncharacterized protein n=1 Tax=Cylicocyclus nassatus TaxID=53992 RepID=A0AA36H4Q1_CYLNA|nr:unnamed protein product [Cylicocyclus nassatus]
MPQPAPAPAPVIPVVVPVCCCCPCQQPQPAPAPVPVVAPPMTPAPIVNVFTYPPMTASSRRRINIFINSNCPSGTGGNGANGCY